MWRKPTLFTALSAVDAPLIHTDESRRGAICLPAHLAAELAGIGKRVFNSMGMRVGWGCRRLG
jgi:hypothetical protein